MQLQDALEQITQIRAQIARTETFRGYRSVTVGCSGVLAMGAAAVQAIFIPQPMEHVRAYLAVWVAAAVLSVVIVGVEMAWRCYRSVSPHTTRLTLLAVEQFAPCIAAGALLTTVLPNVSPESLWMLPGLWAILFSLGVFASYRLLPRPAFWAGVYYLAAAAACLLAGRGELALSPWLMVGTFGGGQLLTAFILYWTLERNHGPG